MAAHPILLVDLAAAEASLNEVEGASKLLVAAGADPEQSLVDELKDRIAQWLSLYSGQTIPVDDPGVEFIFQMDPAAREDMLAGWRHLLATKEQAVEGDRLADHLEAWAPRHWQRLLFVDNTLKHVCGLAFGGGALALLLVGRRPLTDALEDLLWQLQWQAALSVAAVFVGAFAMRPMMPLGYGLALAALTASIAMLSVIKDTFLAKRQDAVVLRQRVADLGAMWVKAQSLVGEQHVALLQQAAQAVTVRAHATWERLSQLL